jgi:hypothetical protein
MTPEITHEAPVALRPADPADGNVQPTAARAERFWAAAGSALVGAVLLGVTAASGAAWGFALAALITLSLYAVFAWASDVRTAALTLLILLCAVDAFEFKIASAFIRTEQMAAVVGLAVIVATRGGGRRWWQPSALESVLVLWLALNVLSSVIAAPRLGESMKILALMTVSSAALVIPRRLNLSRDQLSQAISIQLLVFAGAAGYGLLALLMHPITQSDFGLTFNRLTGQLVASGSLWESNVFGDYCAAGTVAWALLGPRWFGWRWTVLGLVLCGSGLLVSLTRAAWVAFAIVAIVVGVSHIRRNLAYRSVGLAAALLAVTLFLFSLAVAAGAYAASGGPNRPDQVLGVVGSPQVSPQPSAGAKATPSPSAGSGSTPSPPPSVPPLRSSPRPGLRGFVIDPRDVIGRIQQLQAVLYDLRRHPLLGGGTASYGERYQIRGMELWLASLPLRVANDTGIAGLCVLGLFLSLVAIKVWLGRRDLIAATFGLILLLVFITNLSTETLELMFPWLFIGVALACVELGVSGGRADKHIARGPA